MAPFLDFEAWLRDASPIGYHVYSETQRANVGFVARSVAFQTFVTLIPLLVAVFVLVALVAGQSLADDVLALTESFLPEAARQALAGAVAGKIEADTTSTISVALLLWAALGLFKGLDTAFSMIYGTASNGSFVDNIADALVAFGVVLVAVVAAAVAASLAFIVQIPYVGVVSSLLLVVALTVAFLPMYVLFPDRPITLWHALPGAVVAAVGWTALQALFQFYVAFAADPTISGAVGGLLILTAWLYLAVFILLFGAVVNKAMADVRGERTTESAAATA